MKGLAEPRRDELDALQRRSFHFPLLNGKRPFLTDCAMPAGGPAETCNQGRDGQSRGFKICPLNGSAFDAFSGSGRTRVPDKYCALHARPGGTCNEGSRFESAGVVVTAWCVV